MKISIITVFPELYDQFLSTSLIARAQENDLVSFNIVKMSDMCEAGKRIDEPVCGPGAGMIIKPEVIEKAISQCENDHGPGFKIFFSPQGKTLSQPMLKKLIAAKSSESFLPEFIDLEKNKGSHRAMGQKKCFDHIILICSRYEGIDARVEEFYADAVISIGDYVLMGGDVAAQVFLEGFLRLIPGVVGKAESVEKESFSSNLLDYPEYGLPKSWNDMDVPEVVLSGNHAEIENWREDQACKKTVLSRFDWLRRTSSGDPCKKHIPNHYVALMHTEIMLKGGKEGHSSVTSLDLHDTARSCATYGVKNMFMVSPLKDQTKIMNSLLDFWKSENGKKYNITRFDAVSRVVPIPSRQDMISYIEEQEGKRPLVITTSAKIHNHPKKIDFFSQGEVWRHDRPVLFIFGTAQGLSDKVIDESDYLLVPINGMTDYAHLSVRSAVAIILDRWMGLNPKIR